MSRVKQTLVILMLLMVAVLNYSQVQAFDFENDPNFHKFTNGYKSYITPIKEKDVKRAKNFTETTNIVYMSAKINGVTLDELRNLVDAAGAKLEVNKHSDGSSYFIITTNHDLTGHTLVMMVEPKNRYAYVYDIDSYVSEVVDLGEYVQIYQGRTLVPLRKFIETLGGTVKYRSTGHFAIEWPSLHK